MSLGVRSQAGVSEIEQRHADKATHQLLTCDLR